jgi:exonuclease SbcD
VDPAVEGDFVRVIVRERPRPGLADEVRALYPEAVDIKIEAPQDRVETTEVAGDGGGERSPHDLFVQYLAAKGGDDARVVALFDEVYEHVLEHSADGAGRAS